MLKSIKNKKVAAKLVTNVIGISQKGVSKLLKYISNSREVLTKTIPEERHHQEKKD